MYGLYLGVKQCLVASSMVGLLGREVNTKKNRVYVIRTECNTKLSACSYVVNRITTKDSK